MRIDLQENIWWNWCNNYKPKEKMQNIKEIGKRHENNPTSKFR